jgi:Domain of unknown function (DUF397)
MENTGITQWRKASYSNGGGNACVEVGKSIDGVAVRDTTNRDSATLGFTADAWCAFLGTLH